MYEWVYNINYSKHEIEAAFQSIYEKKRQMTPNIRLDKLNNHWNLHIIVSYLNGYARLGIYNLGYDVVLSIQEGKINAHMHVENALKEWRMYRIMPLIFFSVVCFILAFFYGHNSVNAIKFFSIIGVIFLATGLYGLLKIRYLKKKTPFGMSDDEAIIIIGTSKKVKDQLKKAFCQIVGQGTLENTFDFSRQYFKGIS